MPGEHVDDLFTSRRRVAVLEQVRRRHEDAGGAEAALQGVMLPEGLLQRMEIAVRRQPFDRLDRRAVGLNREQKAGPDRCAVEADGAGSAHAMLAADVRAGQSQGVTEEVRQQQPRLDELAVAPTVDGYGDRVHAAAAHARETTRLTSTSVRRRR